MYFWKTILSLTIRIIFCQTKVASTGTPPMKSLLLHASLDETADGTVSTTLEKQLTALQSNGFITANGKKRNKLKFQVLATFSNFYMASSLFLIAVLGIIFLAQNFTLTDQCAARLQDVVKQQKGVGNLESVKLKMASLSHMINAIVLQNAFQTKSITLKKAMAEMLDVQELYLFDTIEQTAAKNVINTFKTLDLFSTQLKDIINKTANNLNKLDIRNTSKAPINQVLFSFNASSFHFGEVPIESYEISSKLKLFMEEIKLPMPVAQTLIDIYWSFSVHFERYNKKITRSPFFQTIKTSVILLESVKSFILDIEQYQLVTDQTYLRNLIKSLDSIQPYVTIIENLLNCEQNKQTRKQFDVIDEMLSRNIKNSVRQESKDSEILMPDFHNEFLKKLLNNGNSLDDLKNLLKPVISFKTQIKAMENVLTTSASKRYSKMIRQIRVHIKSVCASKPKRFSSSLATVKAALENIMPIASLNNSVLNEFKQFLNFLADIKSFDNKLNIAVNIILYLKKKHVKVSSSVDLRGKAEKVISEYKNEFLNNSFEPEIHLLSATTRFFETHRKRIQNLFSENNDFKNILTDAVFTNIRDIIPQNIKLELKNIGNSFKLLSSLLHITKSNNLLTQNNSDKLAQLKYKLEKEIQEIKGYHRLSNFPFSYETTYQLDCSQRVLVLIRKHNLCRIANSFVTNGRLLFEQINNLTIFEKQFIDSARKNFSSFEKSFAIFISEIHSLKSTFTNEDQSLKSLGKSISVLNHINFSTFDTFQIMSTLNQIQTLLGNHSKEVSNMEIIIENLKEIQFVAKCKTNLLPRLLVQTDTFFQSFFKKHSETETDWIPLLLVLTTFAIVLCFAIFLCFVFIRTIQAEKDDNQDKA